MKCRVSPTLGALESTHQKIWKTDEYNPERDIMQPTVFFGLYGLPDFYALWRHKGKKYIFWAGTDIIHFENGYWLDTEGKIRLDNSALAHWINDNCEVWTENNVERLRLVANGIKDVKFAPSFLGDISSYDISYKQDDIPKVYLSVSGDNFEQYGWDVVERIASQCNVEFHLYGSDNWKSKYANVIVHGRVKKEIMNYEIQNMQCGLRPLGFDGFSEILAKSVLWGQHCISRISYPFMDTYVNDTNLIYLLNKLREKTEPNIIGRNYYLQNLNKLPWVE